ncbi:MipA/OmpV family protein [Photobacterium sp. SDRW27]|uniref:MipA/OmpV family protein n=1 Tax=Photobacterium obscurum TaxID=2829490 RepID=UPI002244A360|nr:MipA/OmpV family protein [Photobacterium obscurum]MCW8330271.1 MipA/OmpV family protein [Photobacterium obscurum]
MNVDNVAFLINKNIAHGGRNSFWGKSKNAVKVVLAAVSLVSAPAFSGQLSLGAITSYSPEVYKETDANVVVIPAIGYESPHLFFRGFSAGARLYPIGTPTNVIFRLAYDPRTLKPSDSDNVQIQLLDEREASILGGVSYQMLTQVGIFEVGAGTDLGSKHNGLYAEASWRLPIRMRRFAITPQIGYAYNSDRINNHLYGVSNSESTRSGLEAFDADWDGQYFVGLSGYMFITNSVRLNASVRYTNLEGDIENSPIIAGSVTSQGSLGITYVF